MTSNLTDYSIKENIKQLRGLLISDEVDAPGKNIFLSLARNTALTVEKVFIVAVEFSSEVYKSLPEFQSAEILDLYGDFQIWLDGINKVQEKIFSFIQRIASCHFSTNILIIVDSFDPFSQSSTKILQILNKFITKQKDKIRPYIMGLCHRDVTDIRDIATIFPFHIRLRVPRSKVYQCECEVIKRKASGKLECTNEGFNFINKKITDSRIVSLTMIENTVKETDEIDPTKNLSFNLNLTEREEEARRKLQLPYVKTNKSSTKDEGPKNDAGKGIIYYEPDEADDFDEEDPDDDLDI